MNMYTKPKLNIPRSRLAIILDIITAAAYIGGIIYLIVIWSQLPDQVPGHYDGVGEVTRWGSKWELILLPAIAAFLAVFMSFLERHPEWHNYMNLNEGNIEFQYQNSMMLLNVLKNECVLLFVFLNYQTVQVALGRSESLGNFTLPVILVVILGSMIFFIIRSVKHK